MLPRQLATRPHDTPAAETVAAAQTTQQIAPAAPPANASGVPSEAPPAIVPPKFDAAYLANPPPPYPGMSRRLNETGRVLLRVKVSPEGLPTDIDIAQSSGYPRLDEAAREAVRGWKFIPA
ncbi:MAG TPA: energy transducer TonB, partial [Rhodocyclaceae bacterium]|nr:energy transducer TonB [Rhodocyclaceae bacterium]